MSMVAQTNTKPWAFSCVRKAVEHGTGQDGF
nr:MAG TPA: hypothetical protein [Caudoviricetes sp.]